MKMGEKDISAVLFFLLSISIIFPLQLPIGGLGSNYASINSVDVVLFFLFLYYAFTFNSEKIRKFKITMPKITAVLLIISGWIILTSVIVSIRTNISILASSLWILKWFEGIGLFLMAQNYLTPKSGKLVFRSIFLSGIFLSALSLPYYYIFEPFRLSFFFGNPNVLSTFLNLVIIMGVVTLIEETNYSSITCLTAIALAGTALILTGSRTGILGLVTSISILTIVYGKNNARRMLITYIFAGTLFSTVLILFSVPKFYFDRLTGWITFESGKLSLTDSGFADPIRTRIRLIDKAIELFNQYPVFGHGWYSSPSRIGYLDIHYTTLLAEMGVIGFLLFIILYIIVLKKWSEIDKYSLIGTIGFVWFATLLIQSIGGNFPRIPQISFIYFLLLAAGAANMEER